MMVFNMPRVAPMMRRDANSAFAFVHRRGEINGEQL